MLIFTSMLLFSCVFSGKAPDDEVARRMDSIAKMDSISKMDSIARLDSIAKIPATFIDSITMPYDSLMGDCQQLIVVYNAKASDILSKMQCYELKEEGWTAVDSLAFPCNVGKKGFAPYGEKAESDGKSPTGIFTITQYFSKDPKFTAKLEKINITRKTIWVDDSKDPMYNTYYEQNEKKPKSGEILYRSQDGLYDYVMVIDYNTERKPYKGSAIFLHCWRGPGKPTLGCVAVEKKAIFRLFGWIDAEKHPKIVMGSLENEGIFNIGCDGIQEKKSEQN